MGEFDTTLGALCVAYVLAWELFGVMSMQSFDYFQKFVKDSVWLKSLVGFLWALDTLQLVLIGHVLYYWVITNYDNPKVLADELSASIIRVSPAFAAVVLGRQERLGGKPKNAATPWRKQQSGEAHHARVTWQVNPHAYCRYLAKDLLGLTPGSTISGCKMACFQPSGSRKWEKSW
ncbi:hypothetical protein B0H13DRAFT_2428750 [Mycena leptocephala]|nr:hypothetical protein B0H13DRAFT_2428750 [Mycena leptocephala]